MSQAGDLVVLNGTIRTVDPSDSIVSAVLVRRGRFAAMGTDDQVRAAASADARVIDLAGRTGVPGMIDPHNHLAVAAFEPDCVDCSTPPLSSLDEVLDVIARHCHRLPPGQWVRAMNFASRAVPEQRGPHRRELDEAAPDNPLLLVDVSCHAGWTNSRGLRELGIGARTPQPWGGVIGRDRVGEPDGLLLETACGLAQEASWSGYATRDPERAVELVERKLREYLSLGITALGDAMVTHNAADLYRRADAEGRLPMTVVQIHHADHFFAFQDLRREDLARRARGGRDTRMLRTGGLKIFADPGFPDGPAIDKVHDGCTTHHGSTFYSGDQLSELVVQAHDIGIQTVIHAMGNRSVDMVLDAYEKVRRRSSDGVLRIEHAFVAAPEQGERIAALDVDLVVNPGLCYDAGSFFAGTWRGADQPQLRVIPVRSMIEAGARVSFASDHPCGTADPMRIIWSAASRCTARGEVLDPEEAVTPTQALRACTIDAAHACQIDREEGSIEVGKRANLVVLDRDPVVAPVEEIRDIRVDLTFVDGQLVHERTAP